MLPDVVAMKKRVQPPDFISINLPHGSQFPVGSVCLEDAVNILCEVRFAIHEYYAHSYYYRKEKDPPNEGAALFLERFFLDDAILRLYACGEHLASAIAFMLELPPAELNTFKEKRSSLQATVGRYLASKQPGHPLTVAVSRLSSSDDWMAMRDYRDKWVHEQPPHIKGTGIVFPRKRFWVQEERGGWALTIGQQYQPELTIEEIAHFTTRSFEDFFKTISDCFDYYEQRLTEVGFKLSG